MVTRLWPLLVPLLFLSLAGAQPALHETPVGELPPQPLPTIPPIAAPAPALDPADTQRRLHDAYAATTGERLDREEVDVRMDLEFRDVQLDALGVILGGGSFGAHARLQARLDFHVISVGRLQESLEEAAGRPLNLTEAGLDARNHYLTADAFRTSLAGEMLAAFQDEQEARVTRLVTDSFPDVYVRGASATWSNTSATTNNHGDQNPTTARPIPTTDPRNPPVTLLVTLDLEHQSRRSLVGLLENLLSPTAAAEAALEERLGEPNRPAPHERSLYALLGIPQVIDIHAPPGWDVDLRLRLPEGITIEEASPDVHVTPDLRAATTRTHARDSEHQIQGQVSLTLGSRSLVSLTLLGATLLMGAVVRVPAILLTHRWVMGRR